MLILGLVLWAGVVGGLGVPVIIRFAFTDNNWDVNHSWWLSGRGGIWHGPRLSGVGPVLTGALGVALSIISAVIHLTDADANTGAAMAATISCLVGYALYKWWRHRITLLAILSLPLSIILIVIAVIM